MATCDIVHEVGDGRELLDIGGGASAQVMANALEVDQQRSVRAARFFINIFGGITKGRTSANGSCRRWVRWRSHRRS